MRFNFQMTDLQAAVGLAQLKKLPQFLERRAEIYNQYQAAGLSLQDVSVSGSASKPIRYRAILKTDQQENIIKQLELKNIKAIVPVVDWELLSPTSNALQYTKETVSLPLYPSLTDLQVESIINALQ